MHDEPWSTGSAGPERLRLSIAAEAARLIADNGLDYRTAKTKAARNAIGQGRIPRDALPDNDAVDSALREHLALFDTDHPRRLERMRAASLGLMELLAPFHPFATGAVWKGLATEHAPLHLQLFHDNGKEVSWFLIERRFAFETVTVPHFRTGEDVEALTFDWQGCQVLLSIYGQDDLRGALRAAGAGGAERGDRSALLARIQMEEEAR